jgi:hypothetical protein
MIARALAVLTITLSCGPLSAHDLEWQKLLLATLQLRQGLDYDANVDSYMEVFRPDVWNRYRNDEFELEAKREETIELMKRAVSSFNLKEDFVVRTSTEFGNYDFSNQTFPLGAYTESTYFYKSHYPHGSFPDSFRVFMKNFDSIREFEMSNSKARDFLQSRKDRNGRIDRRVHLLLHLRIIGIKSEPNELHAEITKAWIYNKSNWTQEIARFEFSPKPAIPTSEEAMPPNSLTTSAALR